MTAFRLLRRTIGPATIAGWLLTAALAPAQEAARPWGFLSPKPGLTDRPEAAPPIDLRCNVTQPVYLYLVNPTDDTPTVSVLVHSGGSEIGRINGVKLPAKAFQQFALTAPAPASKTPAGVSIAYDNKSNRLTFSVGVADASKPGDKPNDASQVVILQSPASLLSETTAVFTGGVNQLSVNVKANSIQGPPCTVDLVLSPDEIHGLQKGDLKGITHGALTPQQPSATLTAGGLTLAPGSSGDGRASLTVDGVERAVLLKGSFQVQAGAVSNPFTIDPHNEVQVRAPRFAKPGDAVAVKVEANNSGDAAKITFTVSPGAGGAATQTLLRSGSHEKRAAVVAGDDGNLAVVTVVKDWTFFPDTHGLYGPVTFKAVVASGAEVKEASTVVVFDITPPKDVKFIPGDPKKFPVHSRPYLVHTVGVDNESQIDKVEFFVGAEPPPADAKAPTGPKPIAGVFDAKISGWSAALPMPDKNGPLPVYVRYTNGVGLSTVVKQDIDVIDPVHGGIKGQVFYGELAQKMDVKVWLLAKDMKTVVKEAKVNAEGFFEIKDVPAGEYVLVTEQRTAGKPLTGSGSITVKEGPDPTETKLTLKMKP